MAPCAWQQGLEPEAGGRCRHRCCSRRGCSTHEAQRPAVDANTCAHDTKRSKQAHSAAARICSQLLAAVCTIRVTIRQRTARLTMPCQTPRWSVRFKDMQRRRPMCSGRVVEEPMASAVQSIAATLTWRLRETIKRVCCASERSGRQADKVGGTAPWLEHTGTRQLIRHERAAPDHDVYNLKLPSHKFRHTILPFMTACCSAEGSCVQLTSSRNRRSPSSPGRVCRALTAASDQSMKQESQYEFSCVCTLSLLLRQWVKELAANGVMEAG